MQFTTTRWVYVTVGLLTACSEYAESSHSNTDSPESLGAATQAIEQPAARPETRVGKKLMIIGTMTDAMVGSVTDDAIYVDRIAADVGGAEQMRVLIMPGASVSPNWFYTYMQAVLVSRGVPLKNVELAHIASVDDDTTPDVDESTWSNGAYQLSELVKVAHANVIWFEGGNQDRLVPLLLDAAGQDSPVQAAIKAKLAGSNLIIAGYSAGAAVMSDPMIGNGTAWGALTLPLNTDPNCETGEGVCVTKGLGYVPARYGVITDQHFTQRGRFPRLIRALAAANKPNGWGVSEFSGFYVDLRTEQAEVVGVPTKANVTIIGRDGAKKNHEQMGPPFLGDGYTVSVLAVGDTYTLPSVAHPHGVAHHPITDDYYAPFSAYYEDMPIFTDALGSQVLVDDIVTYFVDGTPQASGARVDSIAFVTDESGSASGFRFRFTADRNSEVAWNEDVGYSMFNARLKISTISARFTGIGPE
jgi:cyanophycinase